MSEKQPSPEESSSEERETLQQRVQQKFLQFKFLQQQLEQIAQHLQLLKQQQAELESARESVETIGKSSVNTEILAPLAEGLFMKVQLQDNAKVILNVGANTAVEKDLTEVQKILENQKQELTLRLIEGEAVVEQLQQQVMKIYKEIEPHLQSE